MRLMLHFFAPGGLLGPDVTALIEKLATEVDWLLDEQEQICVVAPTTFGEGPGRVKIEMKLPSGMKPQDWGYEYLEEMHDGVGRHIREQYPDIEIAPFQN